MRHFDSNTVFAVSALANLCLVIIPIVVILIGEINPVAIALNAVLTLLAIIALAATAFLFIRNDQQKRFLMAVATAWDGGN